MRLMWRALLVFYGSFYRCWCTRSLYHSHPQQLYTIYHTEYFPRREMKRGENKKTEKDEEFFSSSIAPFARQRAPFQYDLLVYATRFTLCSRGVRPTRFSTRLTVTSTSQSSSYSNFLPLSCYPLSPSLSRSCRASVFHPARMLLCA